MVSWFDPQVLFIAFCLLVPLFSLTNNEARIQFAFHIYNIAAFITLYLLTRYATKASQEKNIVLTTAETRQTIWWLLNGIFIHFIMDGCTLFSNQLPKLLSKFHINYTFPEYYLHQMYGQMDSRYFGHPTVDTVTVIELFIMFPLCCMMYWGVKTHAPWRAPLQIVTSVFQLFGTFMYVGPEFFESPVLKHFNYVDYNFEFTQNHFVLFWFAFSANVIWIIIPTYFIWSGVVELSNIVSLNVGNVIPISSKTFVFSPLAFNKGSTNGQQQRQYPTSPQHINTNPNEPEYEIQIINQFNELEQPQQFQPKSQQQQQHINDAEDEIFDDSSTILLKMEKKVSKKSKPILPQPVFEDESEFEQPHQSRSRRTSASRKTAPSASTPTRRSKASKIVEEEQESPIAESATPNRRSRRSTRA